MFASQSRATVPMPFNPPHTVTVQKLTGKQLELAEAECMAGFVLGRNPRNWAKHLNRILAGTGTDADVQHAQRDPLSGFDRLTVARFGVKAWTCSESVNAETIADLDDEALEWIALEVMRLTKPALFESEPGAERKNG